MAKKMDATEESVKYLRDIAEREAINRFTSATLNFAFDNQNTINGAADLDGIVTYIAGTLREHLDTSMSGVQFA